MARYSGILSDIGKASSYIITKVVLTWQFVAILALFMLGPTIKEVLRNTDSLKAKGFELTFKRAAFESGLSDTTTAKLSLLDFDALQFFLIKGGIHGDDIKPHFSSYLDSSRLSQINILLDSLHLLTYDRARSGHNVSGDYWFVNEVTSEGTRLHSAIMAAIYTTFKKKE